MVTRNPIDGCNNIVCDSPFDYGVKLFRYLRNSSNAKVISVTGSVGKTSTKEMIQSVLKVKFTGKMVASIDNWNTSYKVSTSINKLKRNTKVYLQEVGLGATVKTNVKMCAIMLNTDIAVYTNIRDSHIETYGSREKIMQNKSELSRYGKTNGIVIINYDDDILRNYEFGKKTYSFSLKNKNADFYAKNIKITSDGTMFTIVDTIKNKTLDVSIKLIGEHHVLNAIVAYITGKIFKMKDKKILLGLQSYKTKGIRQNLINLGSYNVFADCYNSSYDALENTLKSINLMETKGKGKKIAVIGDIFELGSLSEEIHKKVGKLLSQNNLNRVFFIGNMSRFSYEEYKKYKDNSKYFERREDIIKEINETVERDDIILFKASHGMHLYEIIDSCFGTKIGEKSDLSAQLYIKEQKENFEFIVFNNHITVGKYNGNQRQVILEDKYKDLPIEKLGDELFKDNKNIEEITLPKYTSRINNNCFENSSLKKIKFNENMRIIGKEAFLNCENIEEIILPDKLLIINSKAFSNCNNLEKIYIPRLTRKISKDAFKNSNNVVICCEDKSYAEKFAVDNNIKYEIVE